MSKKRRTYKPEEKANIVLEILREESTVNEIAQKYGVSPQLISRWRTEFLDNMPAVFDKKASESEKLKQEYEAEKEELISQIGQLTVELNWLKKKQQQVSKRDMGTVLKGDNRKFCAKKGTISGINCSSCLLIFVIFLQTRKIFDCLRT